MSKIRKVQARFAQVAWSVVQDDSLSYTARGIYATLMSRPDDWKISVESLTKASEKDGRQKVTGAVDELIAAGVYHRIRGRRGRVWISFVVLSPEPCAPEEAADAVGLSAEFDSLWFEDQSPEPPENLPGNERNSRGNGFSAPREVGTPTTRHPIPVSTEERVTERTPTEFAHGNAAEIVASWIDWLGQRPPGRIVGQVAKHVGELLAEGLDRGQVTHALAEMSRRGLHPATLASLVHEQQVAELRRNRSDLAPVRLADARNGSPEGGTTRRRVQEALALAEELERQGL